MNDATPEPLTGTTPSLAAALRKARIESAELSDALGHIRGAEMARLDMLHDALRPVLKQVPHHIDLFDVGLMPGEHPRLFIDMIAFVELAADRRTYRFVQDTRHGRIVLAQGDRLDDMAEAVAAYVARRLVERERALGADIERERALSADVAVGKMPARRSRQPLPERPPPGPPPPSARKKRRFGRMFLTIVVHAIECLGVATLLILLIAGIMEVIALLRRLPF